MYETQSKKKTLHTDSTFPDVPWLVGGSRQLVLHYEKQYKENYHKTQTATQSWGGRVIIRGGIIHPLDPFGILFVTVGIPLTL